MRIDRRIPDRGINSVEDSLEVTGSIAQEAAKPQSALLAQDLRGIVRRDRRDVIGKIETGLQEPDLSKIFDAVNVERLRRQTDRGKRLPRKHALIGKVVNRHHRGRTPPVAVMQIRQGKSGVPIMGMDDVGRKHRNTSQRNIGGYSRQSCKAQRVVRPFHAVRPEVRISGTRKQMRRIKNKQAELARCHPEKPGFRTKQVWQMKHPFNHPQRVHDAGISRYKGANFDALRLQGDRKRAGHVGEFTSLDQGIYL